MSNTDIKNGLIVDKFNNKKWYKNDLLHRDNDLPAIEYAGGSKSWYMNGKRHREDGYAVKYPNGWKEWWVNGERHRENGPAIESVGGWKEWWIYGQRLSEAQFNHYVEIKQLKKQLEQNLIVNNVTQSKPVKL